LLSKDKLYILNYDNSMCFDVPIKREREIVILRNKIKLMDTAVEIEPPNEIKDCCIIKDSTLFVIIGNINNERGDYVSIYKVKDNKIIKLDDVLNGCNPWKIVSSDVDNDTQIDICIGVWKKAKFHPIYANRLFIYEWDGKYLYPKWLGSRLSCPFVDFTFFDVDYDGLNELISIEKQVDGFLRIISYKWNEFGFSGFKILSENIEYTEIEVLKNLIYGTIK